MCREDDERSLGDLVDIVDEDRAPRTQLRDDVGVVDDLLADVDRRTVFRERALDRLDRSFNPRAVAPRRS
jgi:hypothetical protein